MSRSGGRDRTVGWGADLGLCRYGFWILYGVKEEAMLSDSMRRNDTIRLVFKRIHLAATWKTARGQGRRGTS